MKKILFVVLLVITVAMSATTIYDIQYTTDAGNDGTYPSPMAGQEVTVEGVVTAIGANEYQGNTKFFISDVTGGAWNGVYVYDWDTPVQIGDMVTVTGEVTEYYGVTELTYCDVNVMSSGNVTPSPIIITTGQMSAGESAESYEGCLVKVMNVAVTSEADDYGKFSINDNTGECKVNDLFDVYPEPSMGDNYSYIMGMGHYDYGDYTIEPRTSDDWALSTPVSNSSKSWGKIKSIYK